MLPFHYGISHMIAPFPEIILSALITARSSQIYPYQVKDFIQQSQTAETQKCRTETSGLMSGGAENEVRLCDSIIPFSLIMITELSNHGFYGFVGPFHGISLRCTSNENPSKFIVNV